MKSIGAGMLSMALLVIGTATQAVHAGSATIGSDRDNTLYEDLGGSLSNGSGQFFFAGTNAPGSIRRGLIYFDVAASVPAGATITSVDLTLHAGQGNYANTVDLHRLLADWGEGASDAGGEEGSGDGALAGDATWIHTFSPGSLWTTPGGDFSAGPSGSALITGPGFATWTSTPGMLADAQLWLDNPGSNYGWALLGDETLGSTAIQFASRENSESTFRPSLTIEYTTIPAPSALALLALGAIRSRRRRL